EFYAAERLVRARDGETETLPSCHYRNVSALDRRSGGRWIRAIHQSGRMNATAEPDRVGVAATDDVPAVSGDVYPLSPADAAETDGGTAGKGEPRSSDGDGPEVAPVAFDDHSACFHHGRLVERREVDHRDFPIGNVLGVVDGVIADRESLSRAGSGRL